MPDGEAASALTPSSVDVILALGGETKPYVFGVDMDFVEIGRRYGSAFAQGELYRVGGMTGSWQVWVIAAEGVEDPRAVVTECFTREVNEYGRHGDMLANGNYNIVDYLLFADLDLLRRSGIVVVMRGEPQAGVLDNAMDVEMVDSLLSEGHRNSF